MKVDLYQLTEEVEKYNFDLLQESFTKIDSILRAEQGIHCQLKVKRFEDKVMIRGTYQADLIASCDYCLEDVFIKQEGEIDLILLPENSQEDLEDKEISLSELEMDYYSESKIDLGFYMEDQVLLDLPGSLLCKQDCKGICSLCGINKNHQSCQCSKDASNSPFAILKELQNKED